MPPDGCRKGTGCPGHGVTSHPLTLVLSFPPREDISFFDANQTGHLVNRLTADIQEFKSAFKLVISQVGRTAGREGWVAERWSIPFQFGPSVSCGREELQPGGCPSLFNGDISFYATLSFFTPPPPLIAGSAQPHSDSGLLCVPLPDLPQADRTARRGDALPGGDRDLSRHLPSQALPQSPRAGREK